MLGAIGDVGQLKMSGAIGGAEAQSNTLRGNLRCQGSSRDTGGNWRCSGQSEMLGGSVPWGFRASPLLTQGVSPGNHHPTPPESPAPVLGPSTHCEEGTVEVQALPTAPGHCHPPVEAGVLQGSQGKEQEVEAGVAPQESERAAVVVPVRPGQVT